jgi:hypothetical protein
LSKIVGRSVTCLVNPVNRFFFTRAQQLQKAGIPVIAIDIPMVGATFVGADNYQ